MEDTIAAICILESIHPKSIKPLTGGQVNQVYLVNENLVVPIGGRDDALDRFTRETRIIRDLQGQVPVAGINAFGVFGNWAYQIQPYIPGEKLYKVWTSLTSREKDRAIRELVSCMRTLHARHLPAFGSAYDPESSQTSWPVYFDNLFHETLRDMRSYRLPFPADLFEDVESFYALHQHFIQDDSPCLVHADLNLGNILYHEGRIAAILDFEFAMAAPREYELVAIEQFCLYPNDYAEEGYEIYNTADFADCFQRLVKYYPDLFNSSNLRQRMDLYAIQNGIHSFFAWGKDHPDMSADARMHPVSRASNFMRQSGARLF